MTNIVKELFKKHYIAALLGFIFSFGLINLEYLLKHNVSMPYSEYILFFMPAVMFFTTLTVWVTVFYHGIKRNIQEYKEYVNSPVYKEDRKADIQSAICRENIEHREKIREYKKELKSLEV